MQDRLNKLVPPRNLTEAKTLASAGQLALPYLTWKRSYASAITAACARCIGLIGGDEALQLLDSYADDQRVRVQRELVRAWDNFDRVEYAQRILSKSLDVRLERATSLEGLQQLKNVRYLSKGWGDIRDLAPVANLTSLVGLKLLGCTGVSDLTPLEGLKNLKHLQLYHCRKLKDLTPLSSLTQLTFLQLSGVTWEELVDLSPLAGLSALEDLELGFMPKVRDLAPIAGLTKLRSLQLFEMHQVQDLTPLSNLINLRSLRLYQMDQVQDLTPLSNLINLRGLILDCPVQDLTPLSNLTNLSYLWISSKELVDLSPLERLTGLRELHLSTMEKVHDLTPISVLPNLLSLTLYGSQPSTDLSSLNRLTSLRSLIHDFPPEVEIPLNHHVTITAHPRYPR